MVLFSKKIWMLLFVSGCVTMNAAKGDAPIGWAVVPGNGVDSTIGGGNGDVVTATTADQLAEYAGSEEPLVILVKGTIKGSGRLKVASNKTIIGVGSNATIIGYELNMSGVSNIIIRNLTISGARDAIATRRTHHVWIDHCDLSDCSDGLVDITNESDYHTVSWTRFSNHDKTMLINSGTSKPEDAGKLNTTVHHNLWDGSNQRNPRVGYGKVHVFNCLYRNTPSYGIGLHSQCLVLAERNVFDGAKNPIKQMYRDDPKDIHHGFCESRDNVFNNCSGDVDDDGRSFDVNEYYLYDFALDPVRKVSTIVKEKVGPAAECGEVDLMPVPGNGAVKVDTTPTLKWTKGPSAKRYALYFGTTSNPRKVYSGKSRSYSPPKLKAGTVYYWRVDQVTPSGTIKGDLWRFAAGDYCSGD